ELRGLDDRQVGGLGTSKDATRVNADQVVRLGVAWSVAHEATGLRVLTPFVERRNLVMVGERHDLVAPAVQEWVNPREQRVRTLARHGHERSVDLTLVYGIQYPDLLIQTARRRLHILQITLGIWACRIVQQDDCRGVWSELVQETEPLGPDIRSQQAHPGCVTSGLIQARDQSGPH